LARKARPGHNAYEQWQVFPGTLFANGYTYAKYQNVGSGEPGPQPNYYLGEN
jgi:hypothetical protein